MVRVIADHWVVQQLDAQPAGPANSPKYRIEDHGVRAPNGRDVSNGNGRRLAQVPKRRHG
jgi:hypothetical protein